MTGSVLQAVRKASGVSQTELARRTHSHQGNISEIENGLSDPGFGTLSGLLLELGYRLIPVPTKSPSVAESALEIARLLAENREKRAFRRFLQLNDDLIGLSPEVCSELEITPPASVSDLHYDALIAGLVEYHLEKKKLPLPQWLSEKRRSLNTPWFVEDVPALHQKIKERTPKSFSKRNVFISESELASL